MRETELKTIGKYEITAEIGRGAMGEVYKARDPLIGRMVALKVITSGLTNKPELLERFYQEARSAGALQHPNIVIVYELGKEGGLPFIAMEYLGGESLEKLIARKAQLPLAQKVGYIIQICRALEYAHKHGVVHRDIKPGNIMGTTEGTVKVVDFGIARLVDASKTQTGTLIGTLGYMSPQQLRGEHADGRSDIWAVGVLFYELLSYKRPFEGDNPAALVMNIISEQPPSLVDSGTDCTAEIEAVIFRMLQKEAIDRYQTMEEVLFDLDPVWRQLQQEQVNELVAESQHLIESDDLQKAQQLLRQAVHADSSNWEAKTLLDKIGKELRRQQALPRIKKLFAKAQKMLGAGQLQEAKTEVQAALQLDSTFQPARQLLAEVEHAIERKRELDTKLRISKQRIAEGSLTDANRQLDEVLALDPENPQAQELRRQIREEVSRREKRKQLAEAVRHARDLWSQLRYAECIAELTELRKELPDNAEIGKLLETARADQAEAEKQRQLAEVRNLLAGQQYERADKLLASLRKDFPEDTAIQNLLRLAQDEQDTKARQQRLQQQLSELRLLVNEGKHAEALKSGEPLAAEFPREFELTELLNFARAELKRAERDRPLRDAIRRARELMGKESFGEAAQIAEKALSEFPASGELAGLRDEARKKHQEKQRQEQLEKRIREVKTMITRNELTDAIELARETIATLGPDTNVTQLLETAASERTSREKKKEQDQKMEEARNLLAAGDLDDATRILDQGLATQLLDPADPRVQTFLAEAQKRKEETSFAFPPAASQSASREVTEEEEAKPATEFSATIFSQAAPELIEQTPTPSPLVGPPNDRLPAAKPRRGAPKKRDDREPTPAEVRPAATARRSAGKKPLAIAAAGIAIAAAIGAGIYFRTRQKVVPAAQASRPETPAPRAMSQPQQPIQKAQSDKDAQAALEKENALWNQAVAAYQLDKLNQAEREFRQIATMKTGIHQADARMYVDKLIPKARESDRLFKRGQLLESRSGSLQSLQLASKDFKRVIGLGGPLAKAAARLEADLAPQLAAAAEFSRLVEEYNAGTDNADALRKLQAQFRALEKRGGALGSESRMYAEQRIPAELKNMGHPAAKPASATPKQPTPTPAPSVPARHFPWVAKMEPGAGLKLENHLLPIALVTKAAANHNQFELRLTVDRKGRVIGGRVVSGDPRLGQAVVNEARKSWRFSKPSQKTSVLVSVQF